MPPGAPARNAGVRLADEARGLLRSEHAALELEAALRILGQLRVIVGTGCAQIALRVDVQADRPENRLREAGPQERQRDILVEVVDAAQRGRIALIVQEVTDVVQQRGTYQLGRGGRLLGEVRALERVLKLADALAFVGASAFAPVQLEYLFDYQGIE
jgi:hypothetical protein